MSAVFSVDLLQDIQPLRNWLAQPSYMARVKQKHIPTGKKMLSERWQIHWMEVLTYIHEKVLSIMLSSIHKGLLSLGLTSASRTVELINLHLCCTKNHLIAIKRHGLDLLSLSRNCHELESREFYLQEPIQIASIRNKEMRALTIPTSTEFKFFHSKGLCRGMCFWFIYLYFTTVSDYTDKIEHITAVAKQFEEGAPSPAALLHSLIGIEYPLLSLLGSVKHVSFIEFEKNVASFAKYPPGVYSMGLGTHRLNYIKFSETEAVIFDPNMGAFRFCGQEQMTQSHQYICSVAKKFNVIDSEGGQLRISYCTGIDK